MGRIPVRESWLGIVAIAMLIPSQLFGADAAKSIPRDVFRVSEPEPIRAPDGSESLLTDINARGQVVGVYGPPPLNEPPGLPSPAPFYVGQLRGGGSLGFVWSRERGFQDLGVLAAHAINDCGDIAGTLTDRVPYRAFRRIRGEIQDLGTLQPDNPNAWSVGMDINERGDVVGFASTDADGEDWTAFLWTEADGMVAIENTLRVHTGAISINNRRQIAGTRQPDPYNGASGGVIWDRRFNIIGGGSLGGRYASANAINAFGEAVGNGATPYYWGPLIAAFYFAPGVPRVQLWPEGETDYFMDTGSQATDIDNRGRIAGTINLATDNTTDVLRAAVWTSLSEYFVLSEQRSNAVALNERGDVIGHLLDPDANTSQAVIWKIHTPGMTFKELQRAVVAGVEAAVLCARR